MHGGHGRGVSAPNIDQGALTTGRKSARGARVEVITRGERRRSWTAEQKCQIVAESLGPELTPAEVARKYAIGSGQLYTWRRQLLSVQPGAVVTRAAPRFAQVELVSPSLRPAPDVPAGHRPPASSPPTSQSRPGGRIDITLPGGVTLRVGADVDGAALRRVLTVLERR